MYFSARKDNFWTTRPNRRQIARQRRFGSTALGLILYIARPGRLTGNHMADRWPGRFARWTLERLKLFLKWNTNEYNLIKYKKCVNPSPSVSLYFYNEWKKSKHYIGCSGDTLITTVDRRTGRSGPAAPICHYESTRALTLNLEPAFESQLTRWARDGHGVNW